MIDFSQYVGASRVLDASISLLLDRHGEIIWLTNSTVPSEYLLLPNSTADDTNICGYSTEFVREQVVYDTTKDTTNPNPLQRFSNGILARETFEDSPGLLLIDSGDCRSIRFYQIIKDNDGPYRGISNDIQGYMGCINSEFPEDASSCGTGNPLDPYQQRLWDLINEVANKALSFGLWSNWKMCRAKPSNQFFYHDIGHFGVAYPGAGIAETYSCTILGGDIGYASFIAIPNSKNCLDTVGHEKTHEIEIVNSNFSVLDIRTLSLREEIADIVGELFEDAPDWTNKTFPCVRDPDDKSVRSLAQPLDYSHPDSYRYFLACYIDSLADDYYHSIGILTKVAFLLGSSSPSPTTHYGVAVTPIGLEKTRQLFWEFLLATPTDTLVTYESSASLLMQLASSIWGGVNTFEYQQVRNAVDAVGIWRSPSIVKYWKYIPPYYLLYYSLAGQSPDAVQRTESGSPVNYLFYRDYDSNPSNPTQICYTYGTSSTWQNEVCIATITTRLSVSAIHNTYNDRIYVFYTPAGTTDGKYIYLDQARSVHGPYSAGLWTDRTINSSHIAIPAGASGMMLFYKDDVSGEAKWRFIPDSLGRPITGDIQFHSADGSPPSCVYDEFTGMVWALIGNYLGDTWLSNAPIECLLSGGANCWSTWAKVPSPHDNTTPNCDMDYPLQTYAGSPAAELTLRDVGMFNEKRLHVAYRAESPDPGTMFGLWTDSCKYQTDVNSCSDGIDRKLPLPSSSGDWELAVPRKTGPSVVDTGELFDTGSDLVLYSTTTDGKIYETKQLAF